MSEDTAVKQKGDFKSKRNIILIILIAIIIVFVGILNYFTSKNLYNGKIAQNIYIEDVNVSNMTKQEALETIDAKYPTKKVNLSYNNEYYTIEPNQVDLSYDTNDVVDSAYNLTRENSYFSNIVTYISTKFKGHDFSIKVSYDEDKLDKKISSISKQINKSSVDASISVTSGIYVKESQTGLKCDDKENKKLIEKAYKDKNYETIALKVDVTQPKIKTEDLKSIDSVLAGYSTTFNSSIYGRSYNIALALKRCSTVVMPGETFSYNKATGPRTISNGFQNASVIVSGTYQDAPGGGVCQGSTTLFNAALLSGLDITQVRNHSKTSSYVPRGRDAMVNDSDSDFKFTNNFNHPVYISAYAGGGQASVKIYGSSQDKVSVSIKTDNFIYNGLPGAKTYRTITKNGKSETKHIYTAVYQE